MIVLPQKLALPIVDGLLEEAKAGASFAKLQESLQNGGAKLVANLVLRLKNGQKGLAETAEHLRYAVEFDPPQLPRDAPLDVTVLKNWPIVGITPTAFETRKIGASMELEAHTANGKSCHVACVAQHTRFLRWAKTDAGKLATGERLQVEQPIFHEMQNTSAVMLRDGQRVLWGVHKVPDEADMLELFILRVLLKKSEAE